jgi:hypothetical protein
MDNVRALLRAFSCDLPFDDNMDTTVLMHPAQSSKYHKHTQYERQLNTTCIPAGLFRAATITNMQLFRVYIDVVGQANLVAFTGLKRPSVRRMFVLYERAHSCASVWRYVRGTLHRQSEICRWLVLGFHLVLG